MSTRWVMVQILCPKCKWFHFDICAGDDFTENRHGVKRYRPHECDECYRARVGESAFEWYKKWKERNMPL